MYSLLLSCSHVFNSANELYIKLINFNVHLCITFINLTFAYFHVALSIAKENTNFDYDSVARVVLAIDKPVLDSVINIQLTK